MQEKTEADGTVTQSIGRGEKADYSAITGEIVLTGWPEVQQGYNNVVATDRENGNYPEPGWPHECVRTLQDGDQEPGPGSQLSQVITAAAPLSRRSNRREIRSSRQIS
jgi:hypothetical protein